MNEINYEELIKEYNDSLANVLRGFRPKYDFLELWVPDTSPVKCILNLVESAQATSVSRVKLKVEKTTINADDVRVLSEEINKIGKFDYTENGNAYVLVASKLVDGADEEEEVASFKSATIPPLYEKGITEILQDIRHESSVEDDDNLLLIRSNEQGISLFIAIDTNSHIIRKAVFSGASTNVEKATLEGLCRIIENDPIQDASDHGVIKLEAQLRDSSMEMPIKGIVNLFNIDPIFQLPLTLIRKLRKKYGEDTGFTETKNFFDGFVSPNWRQATHEERLAKTQTVINNFLKDQKIDTFKMTATAVEKTVKVSVVIEGDDAAIGDLDKGVLLLNLERYVRKHLEPKIEIYQEMWKDKNKTRRL